LRRFIKLTEPRLTIMILPPTPFLRGSKFLKRWMEFLEENADLRYPDAASLAADA